MAEKRSIVDSNDQFEVSALNVFNPEQFSDNKIEREKFVLGT